MECLLDEFFRGRQVFLLDSDIRQSPGELRKEISLGGDSASDIETFSEMVLRLLEVTAEESEFPGLFVAEGDGAGVAVFCKS